MAATPDQRLEDFRKSYLPRLIESLHPSLVILFGSHAKGTAIKESDLDLLVVSASFEGMPFMQRAYEMLWNMQVPFALEVLCYTPEEFERKREEIGIVAIAADEGIDLLVGP